MLKKIALVLLMFVVPFAVYGAGTAKFVGKVTDRETGDPLPGANVVIVGTTLGAATDVNGEYFILNIPPGTYEIQASFIGYNNLTIQNVRAVADLTEDINFELVPEALTGEELVIIAERPVFEKGATNTIRVVDSEQLSQLPIRGATQAVSIQAGVVVAEGSGGVDDNPIVNIRGGRGNETAYYVDGVLQNDLLFGTQSGQISNEAIEQVSMQVGGFEAKYGQAQSGVINITTKSGASNYAFGAEGITSEATDDYGYNIFNFSLSGPILPGSSKHTFFALVERNDFEDGNPKAINLKIPTAGIDSPTLPNNASDLWRWTAKTNHSFGDFRVQLTSSGSMRDAMGYVHSYAKNNSEHNSQFNDDNFGYSARITHTLNQSTFWNLNATYRLTKWEQGDGVFFDNLEAYGDTLANPILLERGVSQGERPGRDDNGVFFENGRVNNFYRKYEILNRGIHFDITSQVGKHLFEFGAGFNKNRINYFAISPSRLAVGIRDNPNTTANEADVNKDGVVDAKDREDRYLRQNVFNTHYGFKPTGEKDNSTAREPEEAYVYLQDKIELGDLVLNLGLRFDYFDAKGEKLRDRENPFKNGDSQKFDDADFLPTDAEYDLVPRIGIGFPVSENTIFHAQYGKFIQRPRLIDLYWSRNRYDRLLVDNNFTILAGDLESEETIQYEAGVRKTVGDNIALDVTAFYKDVKGLVNTQQVKFFRGIQQEIYMTPTNTDFGTIRGLAFKFDLRRTNYIAMSFDYTFSLAEGTGSSQSSSFVAAFRNDDGDTPKAIAPLNFDQRHTLVGNIDIRIPRGEGGILERTGANLLISYNSGRPYTPLETQDVLASSTNFGDTRGYVNSATGPGAFRLDLKIDKSFDVGRLNLQPYLWVLNLTDEQNVNTVFRSTGDEFSTGFLETPAGKNAIKGAKDPDAFVSDYKAFERNPTRFGIPRQIRLGLKVNFR
ncbi:MAG: carboxypeptidase-like regulatory domain-containing protein [bacterium]